MGPEGPGWSVGDELMIVAGVEVGGLGMVDLGSVSEDFGDGLGLDLRLLDHETGEVGSGDEADSVSEIDSVAAGGGGHRGWLVVELVAP